MPKNQRKKTALRGQKVALSSGYDFQGSTTSEIVQQPRTGWSAEALDSHDLSKRRKDHLAGPVLDLEGYVVDASEDDTQVPVLDLDGYVVDGDATVNRYATLREESAQYESRLQKQGQHQATDLHHAEPGIARRRHLSPNPAGAEQVSASRRIMVIVVNGVAAVVCFGVGGYLLFCQNDNPQQLTDKDSDLNGDTSDRDRRSLRPVIQDAIEKIQQNKVSLIDLKSQNIIDDEVKEIAKYLKNNTALFTLILDDNLIGDAGAEYLADALSQNAALDVLSVNVNTIGLKGVQAFSDALKINQVLRLFYIKHNGLTNDAVKVIADGLKKYSLKQLGLSGSKSIDDNAALMLAGQLSGSVLEELVLHSTEIGDTGVVALMKAYADSPYFRDLGVGWSKVTDAGFIQSLEVLKKKYIVVPRMRLSIPASSLGDVSALALARFINTTHLPLVFGMHSNEIGDIGALAIIESLQQNHYIVGMNLKDNRISASHLKKIESLIQRNLAYPQLQNHRIYLRTGGVVTLTSDMLHATALNNGSMVQLHPDKLYPVEAGWGVTFNVTKIEHCVFLDPQGKSVTTFAQEDIDNAYISLKHDGSDFEPSYTITASNGTLTSPPFPSVILFTKVYEPRLRHNKIVVWPNTPRILTPYLLSARDYDTDYTQLKFDITHQLNCLFKNANNGTINAFFQSEIIAGNITLMPQEDQAPAFNFTVSDGEHTIGPLVSNIQFNPKGVHFLPKIKMSDLDGHNGMVIRGENLGGETAVQFDFVGDCNRDGFDDLGIPTRYVGKGYILYGHVTHKPLIELKEIHPDQAIIITGLSKSARPTTRITSAGDLDDNGCVDILLSTHTEATGMHEVFVIWGCSSIAQIDLGVLSNNSLMISGATKTYSLEFVNFVGDFNGDGVDDVVIADQSIQGVHILYGNSQLRDFAQLQLHELILQQSIRIDSAPFMTQKNIYVSAAGDINSDGYDDVIVAYLQGSAWVIYGNHHPSDVNLSLVDFSQGIRIGYREQASSNYLGRPVHHVFDMNGDGLSSVSISDAKKRSVYILKKLQGKLPGEIYLDDEDHPYFYTFRPDMSHLAGQFGMSAAPLGDINGDGFKDMMINHGVTGVGSHDGVHIFFGHADLGLSGTEWVGASDGVTFSHLSGFDTAGDHFGHALTGGDFDGDGASDLAMGTFNRGPGEIYLIYGASDKTFYVTLTPIMYPSDQNLTVLSQEYINATCLRYGPEDIRLTFENIENGRFEFTNGTVTNECLQSQINQGEVLLRHNGSNEPTYFDVRAHAGFWITKPQMGETLFHRSTTTTSSSITSTSQTLSSQTSSSTTVSSTAQISSKTRVPFTATATSTLTISSDPNATLPVKPISTEATDTAVIKPTGETGSASSADLAGGVILIMMGFGFMLSTLYLLMRYLGDHNIQLMLARPDEESAARHYPSDLITECCEAIFDQLATRNGGYISQQRVGIYHEVIAELLDALYAHGVHLNFDAGASSDRRFFVGIVADTIVASIRGGDAQNPCLARFSRFFVAEVTPDMLRSQSEQLVVEIQDAMGGEQYEYIPSQANEA